MIGDTVQVWTLVGSIATLTGVFSAVMFATFAMLRTSLQSMMDGFGAVIEARFDNLEGRLDARFAGVDSRFAELEARVDARFDGVDAKIDKLARVTNVRLNSLEGDMHLIKAHLIGRQSA